MSVVTAEKAGSAVPDVPLPPLPTHWLSLQRAFVRTARENWSKIAMADSLGANLTFGSTLIRALALGRALGRELGPEQFVGVMIPPSAAGAVTNIALLLLGKVPINLNYSASQSVIDSATDQTGIQHSVVSRKLMEKVKLTPKGSLIALEDMPSKVGKLDKAWAAVMGRVVPMGALGSFLPGLKGDRPESIATILFTSGSTGEPKGVVLSHKNILSNVHQIRTQLDLDPLNVVALGVLPFFHSFGLTVGIWTILLLGKKAVYHTSPLDAKIVANLCEKHKITLIAASPTFMRHYVRAGKPAQFSHIVHMVLGAEKLKPETYEEIVATIGVKPLEGYGTTEMSPVAAVNVPFEVTLPEGRVVEGNRRGTVGRPIPGTAIKTTDPETGEDLPRGAEGMIHVKGPQIMLGYFKQPEATAKVLKDGWYCSGDLGHLDPDGFLVITGRLSRFSKVAGEMVPHEGIEAALIKAAAIDEHSIAVTSVPDPKRGERLVVLHTAWTISPAEACKKLNEANLPRLWVPSAEDFIQVEAIPTLGTGKLDLRKIKEIAVEKIKN
ncbi:AMP-binding protein [Tundrisphaera lichenicola]|uniref:AMP-binding protein n=1 Tax=Tundrisphaera lichenicola TaxID=2029860 RepID=UPI003EB8D951